MTFPELESKSFEKLQAVGFIASIRKRENLHINERVICDLQKIELLKFDSQAVKKYAN